MTPKSNPPTKASAARSPEKARDERVVESAELLAGKNEVVILHEGRTYRLRRTRLGKLILTA